MIETPLYAVSAVSLEPKMSDEDKTRQQLLSELEELHQKLAESGHRQAEALLHRYELLVNESRDIILFIRRADGRILEANAAAARSYGYSREDLLKLTIQDLRTPASRMLAHKQMAEADDQGILFETTHLRRDGSAFPVEISSRGATIDGTRTLISVIRDTTTRKDAEQTQNRLAAIVEDSDDAIIAKTLDGVITDWNRGAEAIYGYPAAEVIGRSVTLLIPPDQTDEMPALLKKIGQGQRIFNYETVRCRRDGGRINVSLTVSPIKNGSGEIVGVSSIARDITEKKHVERERENLIGELKEALARVKTLSALLPICSHCKKIRNDEGYWEQLEYYIYQHSGTQFSHGICPECMEKYYSEFLKGKSLEAYD